MYGAYHTLIKYVNCHYDIYNQNFEHVLIEPRNKAWSVFAEAYDADARDFGVSTPHYSLAAWIHWNIHFDDPTRETVSLSPAPACNALQEFVCASELMDLGYPVSSPIVVEPAGDLDSASASASVHGFPTNSHQNDTDVAQNGAGLVEKGFPDSNFCLKKQDTIVSCFAPIDLTKHWSDLAQNGAELSGNEGHNSTFGASEFVPASDLVELGTFDKPIFKQITSL